MEFMLITSVSDLIQNHGRQHKILHRLDQDNSCPHYKEEMWCFNQFVVHNVIVEEKKINYR